MTAPADASTNPEYLADLEQRIVDLEGEAVHLRKMIERIGQEKRTCFADKHRVPLINFFLLLGTFVCCVIGIVWIILIH